MPDELINRLLEVENEAAHLVNDAQSQQDARVREAEQQERSRHESTVAEELKRLTSELDKRREDLAEARKDAAASYARELESRRLNREALQSEIRAILDE